VLALKYGFINKPGSTGSALVFAFTDFLRISRPAIRTLMFFHLKIFFEK
jgi:hypothetical protein